MASCSFVFVFMGPVIVMGAYYVQTGIFEGTITTWNIAPGQAIGGGPVAQGSGSIVNLASIGGFAAFPHASIVAGRQYQMARAATPGGFSVSRSRISAVNVA